MCGLVYRICDGGEVVVVVDGLEAPQGVAVGGDELFVVETGLRRVVSVDLVTGVLVVVVEGVAVGVPPGEEPGLFAGRMPGVPRPFAGVAVGPDGVVYVSANGDGGVSAFDG